MTGRVGWLGRSLGLALLAALATAAPEWTFVRNGGGTLDPTLTIKSA
jgi:hypothetical protein